MAKRRMERRWWSSKEYCWRFKHKRAATKRQPF